MAKRRSKQAGSSPRSPKRAPAKRAAQAPATSPSPQQPPPLKPGEWRAGELRLGDPDCPIVVLSRWPDGFPKVILWTTGGETYKIEPGRVWVPPGESKSIIRIDTQPDLPQVGPPHPEGPGSISVGLTNRGVQIGWTVPQTGRAAAVGAVAGRKSQQSRALDEARRLLAIVDRPEYCNLLPKLLWGKLRDLPEFEGRRWKSGDSVRRAIDRARKMVAKADPDNG
jgi:hypothetical protein